MIINENFLLNKHFFNIIDTPELMELTIGESMKTRTNSLGI